MALKIASRDNIDRVKFEMWPAVLDSSFTKFNNRIEPYVFSTENEILCWLENKSQVKTDRIQQNPNTTQFKNGDPNKIYSVYLCQHENKNHENNDNMRDLFLYSVRIKKNHEANSTYYNGKGDRVNSSFKKIENKIEFNNIDNGIEYSSDMRLINGEFFEGIYPLDEDEKDIYHMKYIDYVRNIHKNDKNQIDEIVMAFAHDQYALKWIDKFSKKLEQVEDYLDFFARGGDIYINLGIDENHEAMMRYIFKTLRDNRMDTEEDDQLQLNIRNMVIDPILSNPEIFQIRYNKTLLTWHRNYAHIIKKTGLMPSKQFADVIMNFSLDQFFKQVHTKENLTKMIDNIEKIYGVKYQNNNTELKVIGKSKTNQPKFHKIVGSFNPKKNDN